MNKRIPLFLLTLLAAAAAFGGSRLGAQAGRSSQPADPASQWRRALDEWDTGDYPRALADLKAVMQSPAAADYRERVALLTGENFVTTEVTDDGRNPRLSPNGQLVAFEHGPTTAGTTRLVRLTVTGTTTVAELPGVSAAFNSTSTSILYLRPTSNPAPGTGDLVVRDIASGAERDVPTGTLLKSAPMFAANGQDVLFVGSEASDLARSDVYLAAGGAAPLRLTDQPGFKTNVMVDPSGAALLYSGAAMGPFRGGGAGRGAGGGGGGRGAGGAGAGAAGAAAAGGGAYTSFGTPTSIPAPAPASPNPCGGGGRGAGPATFGVIDLKAHTARVINGSAATMSADGSTIAWLNRNGAVCELQTSPALGGTPKIAVSANKLDAPALSPKGQQVAFQQMPFTDWEIYVADQSGVTRRVTHEIQHDVVPKFLNDGTLLGLMGEPRDRRAYLYDLASGARTRVFRNNTIRTISPEYAWLPSADGTRLLIQSERSGDTISGKRGVYVVDFTRPVPVTEVVARIDRQLAAENDLRKRMTSAYQPIADAIRQVAAGVSLTRIYEYERAMFEFDTKYIGRPGNARAIDYLMKTYASFGYTPEQQWFSPAQAQGQKTANVVVTLKGTENPDLIYVVGSHFDSVQAGPGADDDTTGTCVLLETARLLHDKPLPATVVFASFTGEEAGDLGSKEFVRLAAASKWNVAGALNNDMIGWAAESGRMDNTIRYSNEGIRDLQHGAAFLFSRLITYDAKYYKSTDAQAFYDGWGDIVGGIGSYPVLANPNYHQATDTIETINFQQVAETAKVTAATIMYLASSPSRLKDVKAVRGAAATDVTWTPSPEKGVTKYLVAYGPATDPLRTVVTVTSPRASLPALPAGMQVAVKAVNARGLEGWDWARAVVQ